VLLFAALLLLLLRLLVLLGLELFMTGFAATTLPSGERLDRKIVTLGLNDEQ
jgi:hypothetical protein